MSVSTPKKSKQKFPYFKFKGTHKEIGLQYGQACKDLIHQHYKHAYDRLTKKINVSNHEDLENAALAYRPYVQKYAPQLDEEIQGVAEGSGLSLGGAYFLQLRAEIYRSLDTTDECTTFAVEANQTKDGTPLIGQNADLPSFYKEIAVIIEAVPDNGPATLMVTPAGQISYIGISSTGMGAFANFIECDGWGEGLPRYFFSRLAIFENSIEDAVTQISRFERASSRNLIMMDGEGRSVDIETIPGKIGRIDPEDGLLAHSNHFISHELLSEEKKQGEDLENSLIRIKQMKKLLKENAGHIDVEKMQEIMRNRDNHPHNLCRKNGDLDSDAITFASVIASPTTGEMWIAVGPPHEYEYFRYSLSDH